MAARFPLDMTMPEKGATAMAHALSSGTNGSVSALIARYANPLPDPHDRAFAAWFERWADCKVVMLGEASHGTAEFYHARAAITRHLIEHHGFTIVAVEADWPDAALMNRFVRNLPLPEGADPFQRFPRWMWRNSPIADLLAWMRDWNKHRAPERQAGFFGLDMYNMRASMQAVIAYLEGVDPGAAELARQRYGCLQPWADRPDAYGRAVLTAGHRTCEEAVIRQCRDLLEQQDQGRDPDALEAAQNARLVASAERYYRVMYRGGAEAWNLRDNHMCGTLADLLKAAEPGGKAVVWAHNSHVGDARHGEMGTRMNEHNLGQLARQEWGDQVALIGFGTHEGTVTAASDWDAPMEVKSIRPSHPDSFERMCHDSQVPRFVLDLSSEPAITEALAELRLQRFIGVIYRPESELLSHYLETSPARQYDGWVWFDRTTALVSGEAAGGERDLPDTWPFGL
ncbi:erythromycin esterase family protein [Paracoccus sp. (in: a-proteobacteria)]|uniref:erythromycin esterase family protein n=1 Tax=Paracoccus sp. TaxID=267 RepID=UPI00396C849B